MNILAHDTMQRPNAKHTIGDEWKERRKNKTEESIQNIFYFVQNNPVHPSHMTDYFITKLNWRRSEIIMQMTKKRQEEKKAGEHSQNGNRIER